MNLRIDFGVDLFLSVGSIVDSMVLGVKLFSFLGCRGAMDLAGVDVTLRNTVDFKDARTGLFFFTVCETS